MVHFMGVISLHVSIITFMAISQVDGFPLQCFPLFMSVIHRAYV